MNANMFNYGDRKELSLDSGEAHAEPMPLAPPTRGEQWVTTQEVFKPLAVQGFPAQAPAPEYIKVAAIVDTSAAAILDKMAHTYRERNAVYGSNYKMVAPLVKVLFPNGVPPELVTTHQWHLFELMLVKLSRFAISNLTHQDSIHDTGVYAAMVEAIIINKENESV
jgi:hypothetical protein